MIDFEMITGALRFTFLLILVGAITAILTYALAKLIRLDKRKTKGGPRGGGVL